MSSERERQRLIDILANIDAVQRYTGGMTLEMFVADGKTMDAVERCLQRITEAIIRIGADRMAVIAPHLPVHAVRGLGNMLRHEYDAIDPASIFNTVARELPDLRAACLRYLGPDVEEGAGS